MTAGPSIDPAQFLNEQLSQASPDLMRDLLTTFVNALLGADRRPRHTRRCFGKRRRTTWVVVADESGYQRCAWTSRNHPDSVLEPSRINQDLSQVLDQNFGAGQPLSAVLRTFELARPASPYDEAHHPRGRGAPGARSSPGGVDARVGRGHRRRCPRLAEPRRARSRLGCNQGRGTRCPDRFAPRSVRRSRDPDESRLARFRPRTAEPSRGRRARSARSGVTGRPAHGRAGRRRDAVPPPRGWAPSPRAPRSRRR